MPLSSTSSSLLPLCCLMLTATFVTMSMTAVVASSPSPSPSPSPPSLFSDSAVFERLSHFKDVGVPGTITDPLNQAAIADGSCRLLQKASDADAETAIPANRFWASPAAVKEVISAIADGLPSTSHPSHLVLTARKSTSRLSQACLHGQHQRDGTASDSDSDSDSVAVAVAGCRPDLNPAITLGYNISVMAASVSNWHRALCAGEDAPAWNGLYDPAYQPQQEALTTSFVCLLACDCNVRLGNLSSAVLAGIAKQPTAARTRLCRAFPWGSIQWTNATSAMQLAALSKPLTGPGFCGC